MKIRNIFSMAAAMLALFNMAGLAQSTNSGSTNFARAGGTNSAGAPSAAKSQSELASKTATFGKVKKDADVFKTALDAHALADGMKSVEKTNTMKGTVTAVFEPRGNAMAILNFDQNYRTAMTALVRKENFEKFPDLKTLVDKEVLVTGKFIDYQGRAEIVLTAPEQIKMVEQPN